MNLLDLTESPRDLGLLSLGLRLMSTPGRFGTALGQAGMGAIGDMQQAQQMQDARKTKALQTQMLEMQIAQQQAAAEEAKRQREADERFRRSIPSPQSQALQSLGADASPTLSNAARLPQVDPRQQFMFDALQAGQIKPMDYFTATAPKAPEYKVVGDSLVRIGGDKVTEAFRPPQRAPMENPRQDLLVTDPATGRLVPNAALIGVKRQLLPPGNSVTVNTGDNKFDAKAAEVIATQFADTYKQGQTATRALGQVNRLGALLEKTGGGFTPAIKVYAGQFGVNTAGLDDLQAAEAVIQSLIPQQRPPGSGTMSDRDVELFLQSLPRLINQPGGNKKIVSTMRALYEYDQKLGQIASDALSGKVSRDRAMELMNAVPNPLAYLTGAEDIHSQADAIINGGKNGKR